MSAPVLHQRKIIRDAVVALLLQQTAAADRVQPMRENSFRKGELPAIGVYTVDEDVDEESRNTVPRELTRDLDLVIAGWVAAGPKVEDDMDALALQIETLMHRDPYLGGAAGDSLLRKTSLSIDKKGDQPMGLVTLTYGVTYRTLAPDLAIAPAPQTGLANLQIVDAVTKPAAMTTDDAPMEDTITLETA